MVGMEANRTSWLNKAVAALLVAFGNQTAGIVNAQQNPSERFTESVSIDVETSVRKRLGTVRDYLVLKQWGEAINLLVQLSSTQGDELIEESPGRYLNVELYCNLILAGLPENALKVYRDKFDTQARLWFETGKTLRDESLLRRVVRRGFISSYGDDALLLLGEFAWERGEIAQARSFWEQALPPGVRVVPGDPLPVLNYPDTDLDHAEILARLVLCSFAEGNRSRAEYELQSFAQMFPEAEGRLAGQDGNLNRILKTVAADSRSWRLREEKDQPDTFALNSQRNGIQSAEFEVGGAQWAVSLPENILKPKSRSKPALKQHGPLSYYPVLFRDMVLLSDGDRIFAWNVFTGKPYWDNTEKNAAVIYPPGSDLRSSLPLQPVVGVPRHTLTLHEGRLYARLGTPITSHSNRDRELRPPSSRLVCLDLAEKQGKPLWTISAGDLGPDWSFEGAPVVEEDRLYVAVRHNHPQTQFHVACYDAGNGKPIWNRKICSSLTLLNDAENFISHHLLTLAGGTIYYSTDAGAIAALEATDGRPRWIVTYESQKPKNVTLRNDHTRWGLTPCLFHHGIVFAAPNDYDGLMAIDSENGLIRWRQRLRGGVRHLLGVGRDKLIVSGNRLWGLDYRTGRIVWTTGYEDPAGFGYGRGMLVEQTVWWPTRDEVFIVDQTNGTLKRRIKLSGYPRYETGGNLTMAAGLLLIAQPTRLVAFGDSAGVVPRPRELSLNETHGRLVESAFTGHTD
ncbi:MAG: PQQ-binding-like beta-propeller repeat protein [Planctomycetes bacterium]|nr:PQQ-binding-like beta-propeller repeat protein [Planctomycetota bacterium]